MDRRQFLGGAAGLLGAIAFGGRLPMAEAAIEPEPLALASRWSGSIVASGGICAPLTPIYDLPSFYAASPIATSLPSFSARRGV